MFFHRWGGQQPPSTYRLDRGHNIVGNLNTFFGNGIYPSTTTLRHVEMDHGNHSRESWV